MTFQGKCPGLAKTEAAKINELNRHGHIQPEANLQISAAKLLLSVRCAPFVNL